jgi:SAM-dependent methyltransferase
MASDAERQHLRATFDAVAEGYEDARPLAPPQVFDDLVKLARLGPGGRLLEIGCGTGQATLPLAERGFSILAVELGANLADVARRKLAGYPQVGVVTSSFEEWDPAGTTFDAVYAFNSFHWIDPDIRFSKSAAVLRPGGSLCVLGSSFVFHDGSDPTWLALAEDYEAVSGDPRRLHPNQMRDRSDEFVESGGFGSVVRNTYLWEVTYSAEDYVALLGTFSRCRSLADDVRGELFTRVHHRIESNGGVVRPTWGAVLYVATTS